MNLFLYRTQTTMFTPYYITLNEYLDWLFDNINPTVKTADISLDQLKQVFNNTQNKPSTKKRILHFLNTKKLTLNDWDQERDITQEYINTYFNSRSLSPQALHKEDYTKLKNSSLWIGQVQSSTRNPNTFESVLPFIIIDIDKPDNMEELVKFFSNDSNTLYITKSFSEKGLHIYYNINWQDIQIKNNTDFSTYYHLIINYLSVKFGSPFADLALSVSNQPEYFARKPLYKNRLATSLDIKTVLHPDKDYIEYLKGKRRTDINRICSTYDQYLEVKDIERQNSLNFINYDRKGQQINNINPIDWDKKMLSPKKQLKAFSKMFFQHKLSKELIEQSLQAKPQKTFHQELVTASFLAHSFLNLSTEVGKNYLKSIFPQTHYASIDKIFKRDSTGTKLKKTNIYQEVYKRGISPEYIKHSIQSTVKDSIEPESITLLKGEKMPPELFNKLGYKSMIIADTKTGKTFGIINWLKNTKQTGAFLVPVNILKQEIMDKYGLEEITTTTTYQKGKIYVGTYDSFLYNKNPFFGVVIFDEVHTIFTEAEYRPIMSKAFEYIKMTYNQVVLLTATPNYLFPDYTRYYVRYTDIKPAELRVFAHNFKRYVVKNLDTKLNNLVYINNVNEDIQYFYRYYRDKYKQLCQLIISDKNLTFFKEYEQDKLNKEYKEINTFLATKSAEVGIGIKGFLDHIFINPYTGTTKMDKASFEQLLNRDDRGDKGGNKVVHLLTRPRTTNPIDIFKSIKNNDIFKTGYSPEFLNIYKDIAQANEEGYKNHLTYFNSSRYVNLIQTELELSETDYERLELVNLSEEDYTMLKELEPYKLVKPFYKYSDYSDLVKWLDSTDIKTYKDNLDLVRLLEVYKDMDIKPGLKLNADKFLDIVMQYIESEIKTGKDNILIKTVSGVKKDLTSLYNVKYQNSLYVFKSKREFGFLGKGLDNKIFQNGLTYSKEDIKSICYQNSLNYKTSLDLFEMFRQRETTQEGKTIQKKIYKLK